jgi:uncharacterized protein (UPF0248 family)
MSKKKGKLVEILSRARFYYDINLYQVAYLDLEKIVRVSMKDFILLSGMFELIPISRIVEIKKGNIVVYQKTNQNK